MRQYFYVGAQESHIGHAALHGFLCTCPDSGSFDVDSYEITVGESAGQTYGVFTAAASQFQYDWIFVVKKILTPPAFQRKSFGGKPTERKLHHMRHGLDFSKFTKFVFSHYSAILVTPRFVTTR